MRYALATLALADALLAAPLSAEAGKLRTNRYWGGSDLPVSCDTVRKIAPGARLFSKQKRREMIAEYHVTPKWLRQAKACLK